MVQITVSNDNYAALLNAYAGEEVQVGHVNGGRMCNVVVKLIKTSNSTNAVKMTKEQIEKALGHPIEIVESDVESPIIAVERLPKRGFFR